MKLLCIVGPTGTGKTALAVHLSKIHNGTLVSADSRQIYRGMDIVTGKDHPADVAMAGIDLCKPDDPFSVSDWYDSVTPIISGSAFPIVVGGTGLYVKTLLSPPSTLHVPINQSLRDELDTLNVTELISRLQSLSPSRIKQMNNSDVHNPRRLVRAIEVATQKHSRGINLKAQGLQLEAKIVGLLPPSTKETYQSVIRDRVLSRLVLGAIEETVKLREVYPPTLPSFSAIGYRSIIGYLNGEITKDQMIETWVHDEYQYAQRQLMYLRKLDSISWYDSTSLTLKSQVENQLKTWYDKE